MIAIIGEVLPGGDMSWATGTVVEKAKGEKTYFLDLVRDQTAEFARVPSGVRVILFGKASDMKAFVPPGDDCRWLIDLFL